MIQYSLFKTFPWLSIDFIIKVNILNLFLNDLVSFCLLPNNTTKAQWLKKTNKPQKLKHLLFLMIIWVGKIVPGLVLLGLTHLLCLTGKVIVLRRSRWFPSLSGLRSSLSWGCLGSCQHILFPPLGYTGSLTWWCQGSVSKLWSSVEVSSLEAHALAVTQCQLHILLVKASHKSSPSPPLLPSTKI